METKKQAARRPSQYALFERARANMAGGNEVFLFLVRDGMTAEELRRHIARRPALWGRFAAWVDYLPGGACYDAARGPGRHN